MFNIYYLTLISCFSFCLSICADAQKVNMNATVLTQNPDDLNNYQAMTDYGLNTIDLRDFSPKGSPYYGDRWYEGTLVLFDDKEVKCPVLYDVEDQEFFINLNDEVFLLPNGVVKSFILNLDEDGLVNSSTFYSLSTSSNVIYYELLGTKGGISLVRFNDVKILAPNYNPAINVGTHKKTYIKEEILALMDKTNYIELKKPRNKTFKKFENIELLKALKNNNVSFEDSEAILTILNNNYKNI